MFLLILKHFLRVRTSLLSQREIFWSTCPNLPNAKFSFRSIPNFFQGMKIYWEFFCSRAMVTWLATRSQKISNIHKRICQLSLFFRVFLNIFGRKWENLLFSIFFRSIQLLIFIFFFMRVLVTWQSSNVKKIVKK